MDNKFSWLHLEGTRIPGLRKFIKHRIDNNVARSRVWLFICMLSVSLTVYHLNYHIESYLHQRITIFRTYKFPKQVEYPTMIMCLPTSYLFSKLLGYPQLLLSALANLQYPNLRRKLLEQNVTKVNFSAELLEMLKLDIQRTIIECKFQTRPCSFSQFKLYNRSIHACFQLDVDNGPRYSTNVTGRDGGFDLLLNLNAYDGLEERPGLSGGFKIAQKRILITNCTTWKPLRKVQVMDTFKQQIKYYDESSVLPCTVKKYFTTKTSAKLRSSVVYRKMNPSSRRVLQEKAMSANQLKSMFVSTIRNEDTQRARNLLVLTQNLIQSFAAWHKPECSNVRHPVKVDISVTYIRGKLETLLAYIQHYLDKLGTILIHFSVALEDRTREILTNPGQIITLNFTKDSLFLEFMKRTASDYEDFNYVSVDDYERSSKIVAILGHVGLFTDLNDKDVKVYAEEYYTSHHELVAHMESVRHWHIDNQEQLLINQAFMHTEPMICGNYKNKSKDYEYCPVEILCPDYDNSYVQKYDMPFYYLRDSTKPPPINVSHSVAMQCFMGVLPKDLVRAYSIDFQYSYVPWFELYRLNQIALAKWEDGKIFDAQDVECLSFQACWRLLAHIETDGVGTSDQGWATFDVDKAGQISMKKVGMMAYNGLVNAEYHRLRTYHALSKYAKAYNEQLIMPFETTYNQMVQFRGMIPLVKAYQPPLLLHQRRFNALIQQFEDELKFYLATSNMSNLSNFVNRRGKIMIGQMRTYSQDVQIFVNEKTLLFHKIFRQSRWLAFEIGHEQNYFLRILKNNVTMSVLSPNLSTSIQIINEVKYCHCKARNYHCKAFKR